MIRTSCLVLVAAALAAAEVPTLGSGLRQVLLNPLDAPAGAGTGGWKMGGLTVVASGGTPKLGVAALRFAGVAEIAGGKGDCSLQAPALANCRRLGLWVDLATDANVAKVGLQFADGSGEVLLRTWDADWTGWRWLDLDLADPAITQAYEQAGKDGKADQQVGWVNLAWFAKAPGPSALTADALVAAVDPGSTAGVTVRTSVVGAAEPGQPLNGVLLAENAGGAAASLHVRWRLQRDPQLIDPGLPDPVDGFDHAHGAASWVEVDGKRSDALMTDDDADSAYSLPWGKGYTELTGFLDLGQVRTLTRLRWKSGDANWVRLVDVAASVDGTAFTAVPGLTAVNLEKKWGWSELPWPAGTKAKVLRFRAHNNGKAENRICLAGSIAAYDGAANDRVVLPDAGATVAQGEGDIAIPAGAIVESPLAGGAPLAPGAYLLGVDLVGADGRHDLRCERILVAPADTVPPDAAGRFGINVSQPQWAASLRRVGFGWVRFENCKWAFFCQEKGKTAFDGSIAPWHVDQDATMGAWKNLGMKVLPYVFVTPEWATSAPAEVKNNRAGWPPKDDADYGDAIYQLVAREGRAKPDPATLTSTDRKSGLAIIDAVELWNEPNLNDPGWGPYVGTLTRFYDTFRAGAEASRRADPALPVSGPGWAGIDLALVGSMAEHRYADGKRPIDFCDIVNVHFYSGKSDPETCGKDPNVARGDGDEEATGTYWQQLHDLVAWREVTKPAAQIWMTETGNDVGGPIGLTERHQAAKVPRCIMLALASGIDKAFIYRETGSTPSMHAGAGLLRNDGSIRPQWYTVATLIRQLQGIDGKALRLAGGSESDWLLWWESGQRRVLSAWSLDAGGKLGLELGPATVVDAFGASRHVDGTATLPLGYFPCYIRPDAKTPAVEAAITKAKAAVQAAVAQRAKLAATPAVLFDFGSRDNVDGYLKLGPPRRYAGVVKDDVWNEARGWGFAKPAPDNTDRHWIRSRRDRDACKVATETVFRFALPKGRWTVQVGAESMGGEPLKLLLAGQQQASDGKGRVAGFTIDADGKPLELGFADWGMIRWLVAVPEGVAP